MARYGASIGPIFIWGGGGSSHIFTLLISCVHLSIYPFYLHLQMALIHLNLHQHTLYIGIILFIQFDCYIDCCLPSTHNHNFSLNNVFIQIPIFEILKYT